MVGPPGAIHKQRIDTWMVLKELTSFNLYNFFNFDSEPMTIIATRPVSFQPRHENKSCSACPEDQLEPFYFLNFEFKF